MNWIFIVIYILGYIAAWKAAFAFALNEISFGYIEAGDVVFSCIIATMVSIVWPIWLVPIALYHLLVKRNLEAWMDERNKK